MQPNKRRGEIVAELGGKRRRLCLTLGALAELEAALGAGDLSALAARFSNGRLAARDLIALIGAGLRGAGENLSDEEVAAMHCDDGAAGFAKIAAELLLATFGGTDGAAAGGAARQNP